jgi:hypothetical protein
LVGGSVIVFVQFDTMDITLADSAAAPYLPL